jgi:four helix bundle protein
MGTFIFTQLDVWKKAHELTLLTYRLTEFFPPKEDRRLTDQACRSAASVATNIAEGFGRRSARDKIRFYNHSEGSLQELRYQYILARDLGYVARPEPAFELIRDVEMMLRRLIAAIGRSL